MAGAVREDVGIKTPVPVAFPFVVVSLVLLAALSAYIRISGAGVYYYNADELMHISISKVSGLGQIFDYSLFDAHPPLEYVLRHYWMAFSDDPGFIRSLSLVFGIALIPVYYRIGSLLDGPFTGLCCAGFVAFSHGCIMQSYLVRNYTVLLFFLSIGFYYFLLWHRHRLTKHLIGYGIFCGLACLTHFAAIFAIVSMAACEAYVLHSGRMTRPLKLWIGVNLALALIEAGEVCLYWQADLSPRMDRPIGAYYNALLSALLYPLNVAYYEFPNYIAAIAGVIIFIFTWRLAGRELRALCLLTLVAMALGMLLLFSGLYPFGPSRHSLWTFPFLATASGWTLGNFCRWLAGRWPSAYFPYAMAAVIFASGWVCYNPQVRFANVEYILTNHEWQGLSQYLGGLDSRSLIVAERADAFLLNPPGINLYGFMSPGKDAALAPYGNTRLLFRTAYNKFDGQTLIRMLETARDKGELEGVDTLVFVRSSITTSAIRALELCRELDKQIIPFSDGRTRDAMAADEATRIRSYPAAALVVSRSVFFDQVAEPLGQAHHCMVRGWHP